MRGTIRGLSCAAIAAGALVAGFSGAQAQSYPTRPISVIVPYAAGGNVDAVARWVAPELGKRLGQTIVIENVAGAGGVIGTERAARAAPDGHRIDIAARRIGYDHRDRPGRIALRQHCTDARKKCPGRDRGGARQTTDGPTHDPVSSRCLAR